jgi:hypothetical protein
MSKLAFMTFAVFSEPKEHRASFLEMAKSIFYSQLESCVGFKDAAIFLDDHIVFRASEHDRARWGEGANPIFVSDSFDTRGKPTVLTLSIWESIEDVRSFAYNGFHETALFRRKEWFLPQLWPTYAMWWIEDGAQPTFIEASRRLEALQAHGSTSFAFDFKTPFQPDSDSIDSYSRMTLENIK